MSFDERQLGELLRMLRPVPDELIARAKELPLHFGEELGGDEDPGDDANADTSDAPHYEDDPPLPDDPDPDADVFGGDDSPDDGWG